MEKVKNEFIPEKYWNIWMEKFAVTLETDKLILEESIEKTKKALQLLSDHGYTLESIKRFE